MRDDETEASFLGREGVFCSSFVLCWSFKRGMGCPKEELDVRPLLLRRNDDADDVVAVFHRKPRWKMSGDRKMLLVVILFLLVCFILLWAVSIIVGRRTWEETNQCVICYQKIAFITGDCWKSKYNSGSPSNQI